MATHASPIPPSTISLWERLRDRLSSEDPAYPPPTPPSPCPSSETDSLASLRDSLDDAPARLSHSVSQPTRAPAPTATEPPKKRSRAATVTFATTISAPLRRGGHALHTAFAARILEEPDAWRLVEADAAAIAVQAPKAVPVAPRLAN